MAKVTLTIKAKTPKARMLAARVCTYAIAAAAGCRIISMDKAINLCDRLAAWVADGVKVEVV